jgi:hypothetical protein
LGKVPSSQASELPRRVGHHGRDLSHTLTFVFCGSLFHPWRQHKDSKYCSRQCQSMDAVKSAMRAVAAPTSTADAQPTMAEAPSTESPEATLRQRKRAPHNRRDMSRLVACACRGSTFHPWRSHKESVYCSRACRSKDAVKSAVRAAVAAATGTVVPPATAIIRPQALPDITTESTPALVLAPTSPADSPALAFSVSGPELLPAEVTSQLWYQAG